MELVYIRVPLPPPPVVTSRPAGKAQRRATAPEVRPAASRIEKSPAASVIEQEPEQMRIAEEWSMPVAPGEHGDGLRFDRKSPMESINPIRPGPPERFRMRRQASLADVLRAAAQLLLWPPGYSDDPCAGLAEAAQALSGSASTKGKRALLEDVVRQQDQYCH